MAYGIVTVPSPPGQAGKSAYQYAADGGYPGTEEEFQTRFAELLLFGVLTEESAEGEPGYEISEEETAEPEIAVPE